MISNLKYYDKKSYIISSDNHKIVSISMKKSKNERFFKKYNYDKINDIIGKLVNIDNNIIKKFDKSFIFSKFWYLQISPSKYFKAIRFLSFSSFKVFSSAKSRPSPWAIGVGKGLRFLSHKHVAFVSPCPYCHGCNT